MDDGPSREAPVPDGVAAPLPAVASPAAAAPAAASGGAAALGVDDGDGTDDGQGPSYDAAADARPGKRKRASKIAAPEPVPALDHEVPDVIPELGYACLCASLRESDIYCSRWEAAADLAVPATYQWGAQDMLWAPSPHIILRAHAVWNTCCGQQSNPVPSETHLSPLSRLPRLSHSRCWLVSRDVNKAGFQSKGLPHVSKLALANARDLVHLIEWNEVGGRAHQQQQQ